MCGEHQFRVVEVRQVEGSSPHVRGALDDVSIAAFGVGIIPACAGSTGGVGTGFIPLGDHPRMCGEHLLLSTVVSATQGSSPHVRGAPYLLFQVIQGFGIIPACAGSTLRKQHNSKEKKGQLAVFHSVSF